MQDLAPLDEIERLRTQFLGLVSHELREPLAAVKGSSTTLLEKAAALDPTALRESHRIMVTGVVERARSTFVSGCGCRAVLVDMTAGLSPVMADRRPIVQMLSNLFVTGCEAPSGRVSDRVAATREDAHVAPRRSRGF